MHVGCRVRSFLRFAWRRRLEILCDVTAGGPLVRVGRLGTQVWAVEQRARGGPGLTGRGSTTTEDVEEVCLILVLYSKRFLRKQERTPDRTFKKIIQVKAIAHTRTLHLARPVVQ